MIVQIIGWYCIVVFIVSQLALMFHNEEKFKERKTIVHIASACYALVTVWCFK